ncbi:hypothetical protein PMAC_002788 [Pneumocystis sp. 'macacae']|nr:hypothetical protein PMAC_002788 [Pneumocystis sp. 'macacae']
MKNKVGSRRGSQEIASNEGVSTTVYRGDESVHQAVSGRSGGTSEVGWVVEIRSDGVKNKSTKEVEAELDLD